MVQPVAVMKRKSAQKGHPQKECSVAQRNWAAALGWASRAWEHLTDEQRLTCNVDAENRRTTGHRRFTGINARRLRDGKGLLTLPPKVEPFGPRPLLKRLIITNRRGRITLKLELSRVPVGVITVWASRPCSQGRRGCQKCPRLGPLPPPRRGLHDITQLYFEKHGEYVIQHGMQMIGKRIYVRIRPELDATPGLYQEARAMVPPPRDWSTTPKKAPFLWSPMEALWTNTRTPGCQHAYNKPATRLQHATRLRTIPHAVMAALLTRMRVGCRLRGRFTESQRHPTITS